MLCSREVSLDTSLVRIRMVDPLSTLYHVRVSFQIQISPIGLCSKEQQEDLLCARE